MTLASVGMKFARETRALAYVYPAALVVGLGSAFVTTHTDLKIVTTAPRVSLLQSVQTTEAPPPFDRSPERTIWEFGYPPPLTEPTNQSPVPMVSLPWPAPFVADTIEAALVRAYQNNPQLNVQRALVRSTAENVAQALPGRKVAPNASVGYRHTDTTSTGAREGLRVLEQNVLLSAATIYMDYLRDSAIVEVYKSNLRALEQTLKQTRDRFNVGEVTRTDVAQLEAQLAAGRTWQLTAESRLIITRSKFRQIIGNEPEALAPGSPVDRFLPGTLQSAVELSLIENPNVTAAMFGIDVSYLRVKVNEGSLLPTMTLQGSVQQAYEPSAIAQVPVPLYQGSAEYALIRQSKETLAQQRLNLETTRDQIRANTVTAWGQLVAGKAQVASAQAQVRASEIALDGVREKAKAGQRTTLDVLNAQQALVNARVALVTAQHDRVVASYSVLNSVGRLSPQVLMLPTISYDPNAHYQQVRDSRFGVSAPDGR
jgi:outer membrane protein